MLPTSRFAPLPQYARSVGGGLTAPQGFLAAGVASGVKKRGKLDLALLLSEQPAVSAATFTSNAAAAAPVRLTRETSDCGHLRAVVVNAGNANACTGKQGLADAARMRLLTANHLRLPVEQVAVCSTGLIGVHLPMDKIEPGISAAAAAHAGRRRRQGRGALRRRHPHHGQARQDGRRGGHDAGGQGQARFRRQGVRHDQPQHGDDALLRHLRRRGRRRRVGGAPARRRRPVLQPHHRGRAGVDQRHRARLLQRGLGREARGGGAGAARARRSTPRSSRSRSRSWPTARAPRGR